MIVAGELESGTRLAEVPLAAAMSISRPMVREALRRLEGEGLVRSDGRSLRVAGMEAHEFVEALRTRAALEAMHAELATGRIRDGFVAPADLRELRRLADVAETVTATGDHAAGAQANRAFHRQVDLLAANGVGLDVLDRLWDRMLISTQLSLQPPDRRDAVAREHRELIAAMTAGKAKAAAKLARAHVLATIDALEPTRALDVTDIV